MQLAELKKNTIQIGVVLGLTGAVAIPTLCWLIGKILVLRSIKIFS